MLVVDCFIFYNEIEILKARLFELYDIVDYFILIEGTLTFTGKNKTLYYNEYKHIFQKYKNKIIHIIVDDYPHTTNPWDREYHQRRCIARGIDLIYDKLSSNDIIIISDVDEIPNYDIIYNIKNNIINIDSNDVYSLEMLLYYYSLEFTTDRKWYHPKLLSFTKYNNIGDTETIRHYPCKIIRNGGWHITYYGDTNFIINKLESFSEQQANITEYKNVEKLNKYINDGVLFFNGEKLIRNEEKPHNIPKYFK